MAAEDILIDPRALVSMTLTSSCWRVQGLGLHVSLSTSEGALPGILRAPGKAAAILSWVPSACCWACWS
jgi:hypothetical protein